ncbi:MAG TPA: glycosyltransferase, partial [Candidatus Acidoferrum sp.]|nr:glycosyltransferase [Candidatus Acidoferrum sp.]
MNILEIIPIMDPNNLWTGPHRVVFDVSKALARKGHNVTVCTSDMSDIKTRIATISETSLEGFKIVRLKNVNKYLSNAIGLVITPELNNFLSSNIQDYDIVHCHEYTTFENIFLHHYAKKYDIPYVIQAHGSILRIGKKARKLFYDVIFGQNILRDATKVIALTRMEAQQYRDMSVNENKIAIISNGIDLTEYSDLPPKGTFKKKYNIQHKPKMILFLGRLHRTKGIDLLIKAYAHLIKTDNQHNTVLVIAGPDDGFLIEAISLVNSLSL